MNPQGNEWNLRPQIMKTTLQAKGLIRCRIKFIPMPQAMKFLDAKVAVYQGWKKLETIPGGKVSQNSFD